MFPLEQTLRIGAGFRIYGDEDFMSAGTLISFECEDERQVRSAWQKADEEYGLTISSRENDDEFTIINDQFYLFFSIAQQHLLMEEQQTLWAWLKGIKPRDEEVQDALDALLIHTLPM